jgi:xanthine dehydrogenase accessory factor
MSHLLSKISDIISKNQPMVLTTIVNSDGSTPRTAGSKMIVLPDGTIIDTIGGGLVEDKVIKKALKVFDSKQPTIAHYKLSGKDADSMDMICGGQLSISLEFIAPGEDNKTLFQKAAHLFDEKIAFLLITRYANGGGSRSLTLQRAILTDEGVVAGDLSISEALHNYLIKVAPKSPTALNFDDQQYFIEPFGTKETVYIFGGGHVSKQIAILTDIIEMQTVVLDDRKEFANKKHFQTADVTVLDNFETSFDGLEIDNNSYVIIVTRGHLHDKTVLREALKTDARYIGMIGSKRKRDFIYKSLIMEGFTIDDLNRVYSPIGLSIHSETPQEIAVSIVAELISVRRG